MYLKSWEEQGEVKTLSLQAELHSNTLKGIFQITLNKFSYVCKGRKAGQVDAVSENLENLEAREDEEDKREKPTLISAFYRHFSGETGNLKKNRGE